MKQLYNVDALVTQVQKSLQGKLSNDEIKGLLKLGEDAYHKDSPQSVGKSLFIEALEFIGSKNLGDIQEDIRYKRTFKKGVNMWIGDNLVGKSSIFKIIKLALTGRNSVSKEVLGWITNIELSFKIGTNSYSSVIRRKNAVNFECSLLSNTHGKTTKDPSPDRTLFEGSLSSFEEFMQEFFFRELSYYTLQWTQHKAQKENPELSTANTSWSTYFKSIYLEADDYNVLFWGQQSELIFQMLLGLELTFPINRLKVRRNHLVNQLGIIKSAKQNLGSMDEDNVQSLLTEMKSIQSELSELENFAKEATNYKLKPKEQEFYELKKAYRETIQKRLQYEQQIDNLNIELNDLRRKYKTCKEKIGDFEIDIIKKDRLINELKDHLEIGAFFNCLEVKTCPNCSHQIGKEKVLQEKNTGNCRLCETLLDEAEPELDKYDERIRQIHSHKAQLQSDQEKLQLQLHAIERQGNEIKIKISNIQSTLNKLPTEEISQKIETLAKEITSAKPFDWNKYFHDLNALTEKKAALKFRLGSQEVLPVDSDEVQNKIELEIEALENAERILKNERTERSRIPLNKLEELYLNQLHAFGLPHYDRVEIKPDFKIAFSKHGSEFGFEEISPSEKLRAKLGLYISLIELDVVYQLGRHPRFIILDSPAGEEGDKFYVEGLNSTLSFIQKQFGEELQVFVGTAIRELASAVEESRAEIKAEHEFFF